MKYIFLGLPAIFAIVFASCRPYYPENPPGPRQDPQARQNPEQNSDERRGPDGRTNREGTTENDRRDDRESERNQPRITENTPDPDPEPPARPDPEPEPTIQVARPVPGKPGFVFSPFNNKIIDVKDFPSGTLVADPTYPKSEKKYFRVP
jgi:hypothetical protein